MFFSWMTPDKTIGTDLIKMEDQVKLADVLECAVQ